MESLYTVSLPNKEYVGMVDDISRMVIIQFTIQFLYYINNKDGEGFFTLDFFLLLIYIILGVCLYWLIFKKTVTFVWLCDCVIKKD
jgi:heme/copper-type cytochrome/quinol oxidase subunit 4